jgi:hypothetical protein
MSPPVVASSLASCHFVSDAKACWSPASSWPWATRRSLRQNTSGQSTT